MEVTVKKRGVIESAVDDAGGIVAFARKNHINKGHVSLAYNGVYLSPKMAELMGFPVPVAMVPCPIHNIVHCFDCETEQVQPIRPKKGDSPTYPKYKKILPTDPAQVARQIEKYMPGYKLIKDE